MPTLDEAIADAEKEGFTRQQINQYISSFKNQQKPAPPPATPQQEMSVAPEQKSGVDRYLQGALAAAGKGAAIGFGQLGDLQAFGKKLNLTPSVNAWGEKLNQLMGGEPGEHLPTSQELVEAGGRKGWWDRADLIPQNWEERYATGAVKGLGSAVPLALLPGGATSRALQLAAGAGGGLAGEMTHDVFPSSENIAPAISGAMVGGGLNAAIRGIPSNAAIRYPASVLSNSLVKAAGAFGGAGIGGTVGGVEGAVLGTLLGEVIGPPIAGMARGAAAAVRNPLLPVTGAIAGSTAMYPPPVP